MKNALLCALTILAAQAALAADYLEPEMRLPSPDGLWVAWVEKRLDADPDTRFFISATGSSQPKVLAENSRHFGADWSPDSKTLLVYDNLGSGQSSVVVFRLGQKGWQKIYRTRDAFHIIWRLDEWLTGGVRLRSHPGGSSPDKAPETLVIPYDGGKRD